MHSCGILLLRVSAGISLIELRTQGKHNGNRTSAKSELFGVVAHESYACLCQLASNQSIGNGRGTLGGIDRLRTEVT